MANSPEVIFELALDAYTSAALFRLEQYGDNGDCGGAWVVIGGRGKFAKYVKEFWGDKVTSNYPQSGLVIMLGFGLRCQSRAVYEAGCKAFVEVLKREGIESYMHSYAD